MGFIRLKAPHLYLRLEQCLNWVRIWAQGLQSPKRGGILEDSCEVPQHVLRKPDLEKKDSKLPQPSGNVAASDHPRLWALRFDHSEPFLLTPGYQLLRNPLKKGVDINLHGTQMSTAPVPDVRPWAPGQHLLAEDGVGSTRPEGHCDLRIARREKTRGEREPLGKFGCGSTPMVPFWGKCTAHFSLI